MKTNTVSVVVGRLCIAFGAMLFNAPVLAATFVWNTGAWGENWASNESVDTSKIPAVSGATFDGSAAGAQSTTRFGIGLTANAGTNYITCTTSQNNIRLVGTIFPDKIHQGALGDIYVVARFNQTFFVKNNAGNFLPWNVSLATLEPFLKQTRLADGLLIDIYNGRLPFQGDYNIFLGYRVGAGALQYTPQPYPIKVLQTCP